MRMAFIWHDLMCLGQKVCYFNKHQFVRAASIRQRERLWIELLVLLLQSV
jgi:hypothetical protein